MGCFPETICSVWARADKRPPPSKSLSRWPVAENFLSLFLGYSPTVVTKSLRGSAKRPFGLEGSFLSAVISLPKGLCLWPALTGGNKSTEQLSHLTSCGVGFPGLLTPALIQNGIMNNLYEACHILFQSFFSS